MKKLIVFVLLLGFGKTAFNQQCIPIPADVTSQWVINYYYFEPMPWSYHGYTSKVFVAGDTLVAGKTYNVFRHSGKGRYENGWNSEVYYFENAFYGLFRMEGTKLIYGYGDGAEDLMFDFSVKTGDTLNLPYYHGITGYVVILDVDSIEVNGTWRKRFHINDDMGMPGWVSRYFIEGIGHEFGLREPLEFFENGGNLYCYGENGGSVYVQDSLSCDFTVGQPEPLPLAQEWTIFPNPAEKSFTLLGEGGNFMCIYTTEGRKIMETRLQPGHIHTIGVPDLQPGIYIVRIHDSRQAANLKLLIR